jgi:hypothetical protein
MQKSAKMYSSLKLSPEKYLLPADKRPLSAGL